MKTTVILLVDFNLGDGIGDTVHQWNLYLYLKKLGYKVSAISFGINKTMTSFNNCFLNGKDHDGEGFYTVLTDCSLKDLHENGSVELIVNQTLNDLKNRKVTFTDEEYSHIGFVSTSFTSYDPLYVGVLEGLIKDNALTISKNPQFFSFLDYASSTKPVGNASYCLFKIPGDFLQRVDFYPFITINDTKFFVKETVMGINPVGLLLTGEVDKLKDIIQKIKT